MNKLYTDWAVIYDEIYQQLFDYNKDFAFYDSHLQAHNAHKILELVVNFKENRILLENLCNFVEVYF